LCSSEIFATVNNIIIITTTATATATASTTTTTTSSVASITTGRLKLQDRKMQDWKMTDKSAGLENAGLEIDRQKLQGVENDGHSIKG